MVEHLRRKTDPAHAHMHRLFHKDGHSRDHGIVRLFPHQLGDPHRIGVGQGDVVYIPEGRGVIIHHRRLDLLARIAADLLHLFIEYFDVLSAAFIIEHRAHALIHRAGGTDGIEPVC